MNVLKAHLRITCATLLANGATRREIERRDEDALRKEVGG